MDDKDNFFSNFKRKTFISIIVQIWLGAPTEWPFQLDAKTLLFQVLQNPSKHILDLGAHNSFSKYNLLLSNVL